MNRSCHRCSVPAECALFADLWLCPPCHARMTDWREDTHLSIAAMLRRRRSH